MAVYLVAGVGSGGQPTQGMQGNPQAMQGSQQAMQGGQQGMQGNPQGGMPGGGQMTTGGQVTAGTADWCCYSIQLPTRFLVVAHCASSSWDQCFKYVILPILV